jgi:hypothetical protein
MLKILMFQNMELARIKVASYLFIHFPTTWLFVDIGTFFQKFYCHKSSIQWPSFKRDYPPSPTAASCWMLCYITLGLCTQLLEPSGMFG